MTKLIDEYIKLYRVLENMSDDELDSDEADILRDQMDPIWYDMSEEEINYIDKLFSAESCHKYGHNLQEPEHKYFQCLTCGSKIPYNVKNA